MKSSLATGIAAAALMAASSVSAFMATSRAGGLSPVVVNVHPADQQKYIDLSRPVTFPGSFTDAAVIWIGGPNAGCFAGFNLFFVRPSSSDPTTLRVVASRGPFATPGQGLVDAPLSPPVPLEAGDLVGIDIPSGACGGPSFGPPVTGTHAVAFTGPVDPTFDYSGKPNLVLASESPNLIALSGGTEFRDGIIAGAGSFKGATSNFRTAMQIVNPGPIDIAGSLVFHPIGRPAGPFDPAYPYAILSHQSISIADVVDAMGVSGLGSIDVVPNLSYAPLVVTRVFDDDGSGRAAGFTEPTVRFGDASVLQTGDEGWLLAPDDLVNYRMNIGVRSLAAGATLAVTVLKPDGSVVGTITRHFDPDEFEQQPVKDYLNPNIDPNDAIVVDVVSGSAIVYGVTVNNATNDTGQTFASRTRF